MKTLLLRSARWRALLFTLAATPTLGGASSAWAQTHPPAQTVAPAKDPQAKERQARAAEAEQLFERAAARMDAKDYEAASLLLERSQALDPSSGTLLNLGECYEQRGLTASAHAAFEAARQLSLQTGRRDRAEVAELRMKRLLPVLRRLTIVTPSDSPSSLVVRLDGKPLDPSRWNQPLLIDPGVHRIEAVADAQPTYSTSVSAPNPGTNTSVAIPPWPSSESPAVVNDRGVDRQRVVAIVSGVVGVAGIATGTVFGLRSRSKHEESDEHCGPTTCRDVQGVSLMEDARRAGNVSTVAFVVGGVACAAAAVLWLAPPIGKGTGAKIGIGPGNLQVAGQW